jgi:hypothetical protein
MRTRSALALTAALVASFLSPSAAEAAYDVGQDQVSAGAGDEYASWNADLYPDYLTMFARSQPNLANNRCLDSYFDWDTIDSTHWDARIARVCRADAYRDSNDVFRENAASYEYLLSGAQRGAGCIFFQSSLSYLDGQGNSSCVQFSGTLQSANLEAQYIATSDYANKYFHMWVRRSNGNADVIPGGIPSSPGS